MSDALKKAGYTIPKHCGICAHVRHIGAMKSQCDFLLGAVVHVAGSCSNFLQEEKLVDFYVDGDLSKFLDKRRYTRSNRHKANTSY